MEEKQKNKNMIEEARQRMSSYSDEERAALEKVRQELIAFKQGVKTKGFYKTIDKIIHNNEHCPLPISVIPDKMGINLCSVEAVSWVEREDGQLMNLTIHFLPNENGDPRNTQQ